jgi:threonine/homoserine/homoserine lactone efflux protein
MSELIALYGTVLVVSISGALSPGPVFAVNLAKSYKSPFAGTLLSLGHAVVEVPLIILIYFGFARFFENQVVQIVLSLVGGATILFMGIDMFRSRSKITMEKQDTRYGAFTSGIIMSVMNPFFLLWWATAGSMLIMKVIPFGIGALAGFILAHWLVDLIWLSFVSVLVYKTHNLWSSKVQLWVFILNSLFLAGFGGYFIYSGILAML